MTFDSRDLKQGPSTFSRWEKHWGVRLRDTDRLGGPRFVIDRCPAWSALGQCACLAGHVYCYKEEAERAAAMLALEHSA